MPTQSPRTPSPPASQAPAAYQLPVLRRTSKSPLRNAYGNVPQTPPNRLPYAPMIGAVTKKPSIEDMKRPITGNQWVQGMEATSALVNVTRGRVTSASTQQSPQYRFVRPPLPEIAPAVVDPRLPIVTSRSAETRPIQRAPTGPLGQAFGSGRSSSPDGSQTSYGTYTSGSGGSTAVGTPVPKGTASAPARIPPNSAPPSGIGRYQQPYTL